MDTKSKGSKKFSFILAGALVILAAGAFLAMYPEMGRQASHFYTDYLKSDQLLSELYGANLVLYKDMRDKVEQREVPYSELYLEMKTEEFTEGETYVDFEQDFTVGMARNMLAQKMDQLMEDYETEVMDDLSRHMDYCVVDHGTGEILKNTERGIEKLYRDRSFSEEAGYEYYVMISYDSAGNPAGISVRDEGSDELLKNVQIVMNREWLKDNFRSFSYYGSIPWQDAYYFYHMGENPEKLTCSIDGRPRNMTFIYGLTREQKANMLRFWDDNSFRSIYRWQIEDAYFQSGATAVYMLILVVLAAAALLVTRCKRYCLHRLFAFRLHLEVIIFGIICLFAGFCYPVISLACYTNLGYFPEIFGKYLSSLPQAYYPALTVLINVVLLVLFFGTWYYFVTALGEVFDLGLKEYIKERSLIVKIICWFARGCRRRTDQFKEEILHVDLGGETEKTIRKVVLVNFLILAAFCLMWMFGWAALVVYSVVLYIGLRKYVQKIQEQYRKLFAATQSIAEGNLQTRLEEDWGVFESYKEELSKIQNGFRAAVDKEVKSQRMKTDLITNVSHDLKTPLTAITTYIELLEDETLSPEVRGEYLGVLKKKSQRLKFLIEDLFEVSKASSGNITLNPVDVDIFNLMRQVYLEYEDRVEDANLIFRFRLPEEKVILRLDSQKTYRIFENLYVNIIKYAMTNTRVYVNGEKTDTGVRIELKNMSATELNIAPEDLTERFVRGDSSRNTEGSGLGLAIARNFVELQGGKMTVDIDGDLFKVTIEFE